VSDSKEGLDKGETDRILRESVIPESGLDQLNSHEKPRAIVLAGQPGAGKGNLIRALRQEFSRDILVVDPDELRDNLPGVRQIQEADPIGWPGGPTRMPSVCPTACAMKASSGR